MGEARQVMDRVTEAAFDEDQEALKELYAPDAVAETPDQGTVSGRDAIAAWFRQFSTAFPDASWESAHKHESGNVAIDEGYVVGTSTGPLAMPGGDIFPPTGKSVRMRGCDAATVEDGLMKSHRFYFDQMDLLGQLGLAPEA